MNKRIIHNNLQSKLISLRLIIQLVILFGCVPLVNAQVNSNYRIIRSNTGAGGSINTIHTTSGTFNISQSIGQSSVIGNGSNNKYYVLQGYQQPIFASTMRISGTNDIKAQVFPNPFTNALNISFTAIPNGEVNVFMYDIHGKLIYSKPYSATQNILLEISNLSKGVYLLRLQTEGAFFNEKVIKF